MGYLAFNLSSKYLQFSKFSVRDIAPRDRYCRAIWVISSDIAPRDQYRRAIWGVLSDVAARFDRFDDFAGVLIVTRCALRDGGIPLTRWGTFSLTR